MTSIDLSPSHQIIEDGRAAWGDEYARAIFGTIIRAVNMANEAVQPPYAVDHLQLKVANIPEKWENGVAIPRLYAAHTRYTGFGLIMDADEPEAVLQEIEPAVVHETARVAIFQHRTRTGVYENNDGRSELECIVEDGMVVNAVEEVLGKDSQGLANYTSYDADPSRIKDFIRQFLDGSQRSAREEHLLRMGTPDFPRPGYKAGHAIVRAAMNDHHMPVNMMLYQKPDFYDYYARQLAGDKKKLWGRRRQ